MMRLLLKISILAFLFVVANSNESVFDEESFYNDFFKNGLLPHIANGVEGTKEITTCIRDLLLWKNSLSKLWALKMLDSGGKFPEAILVGNTYSLGQFDECLSISENATYNNIKGKYCLTNFSLKNATLELLDVINPSIDEAKLPSITIRMGVCIPATCTSKDIQTVSNNILTGLNITTRPFIKFIDGQCQIDEPPTFRTGAIVAIVIFSCFAAMILISTAYDFYQRTNSGDKVGHHDLFVSFSIVSNTEKMLRVSKSSNTLKCLNGIRVFSMCWVVICHRYSIAVRFPLQNIAETLVWVETLPATIIMGGSMIVDTFFIMSGMLLCYVFLCQTEKNKSFNIGMFYLHRFLRIWPAMAATVLFQANLLVHLGSGPVWFQVQNRVVQPCEENWWLNILFIQNFVRSSSQCLGHLWYIAVDTQLYILSPILLIPLLKNRKFGFYNIIFWIVLTQISMITVSYTGGWAGVNSLDPTYGRDYYRAIYVRAAVWMLGFMAGYVLYVTKNEKVKINKYLVGFLWIVSLIVLALCIFGITDMLQNDHEINALQDSTFSAFARTGWGLAMIWIIFACVNGYGGPVNWLLSLDIWEVLGRISYSMYLIHTLIQAVQTASTRNSRVFGQFEMVYVYFGDMVYSFFISYLWAIAFESPFLGLEKALFHKSKPAATAEKNEDLVK